MYVHYSLSVNSTNVYILKKKKNGETLYPNWLSFKKQALEYFKDCPEICKKIEADELGFLDVNDKIPEFYEKNCQE